MSRVKCHLCGVELEVKEFDELRLMDIAKTVSKNSCKPKGEVYKKIKETKWKYVCHDCSGKKSYWDWVKTDDSHGHIAVTAECTVQNNPT
jgi:hypothetical protein